MSGIQALARSMAETVGRESWPIRTLRPLYERALNALSLGRGIPWSLNGVPCRIDARYRRQMARLYDAPVATFLRDRVEPGSVCLDVGANVGVYVLQFAHWAGPTGRVVAFEPNPESRRVLERHVALNGIGVRTAVEASAVGEAEGSAAFFANQTDGRSRLGLPNPELHGAARPITVRVHSLDAYCTRNHLAPDWIVIDVEGFEFAVLRGARRLMAERGSALSVIVEMHPSAWPSIGEHRGAAENLLEQLGRTPAALTGQRDPLGEHGIVALLATTDVRR